MEAVEAPFVTQRRPRIRFGEGAPAKPPEANCWQVYGIDIGEFPRTVWNVRFRSAVSARECPIKHRRENPGER